MIYYDNKTFDSDTKYQLYILKKYLTNLYDNVTAVSLIKKNSSDLNKLSRALGKNDIEFFCLYFLSDIFVVKDTNEARLLSPGHYDLWELANKAFVEDVYDKVNIICPRGYSKTTIFDLAVSIWLVCYQKSKFTLIGAKKDDDAVQFVDTIKKVFKENSFVIQNFGLLIDNRNFKVNANEIEFTNGMYIRAVGSASSVRGANFKGIRPTVVIADDYQSEVDILTEDARDKKYNRWTKEIEQVGDKAVYRNGKKIKSATKIIAIGTTLHIDCLASRLSRNNDYKTIIKRAILLELDQSVDDIFDSDLWIKCKKLYFNPKDEDSKETARLFYEKHKDEMHFPVLWEEKWDCFNDLAIPYWENRASFMSELMNDASSIGERWFKSVRTQSKEEIEEHTFTKTMLCVDPASTTNKKSDYTGMVVGSTATNGFKYMRELIMEKLNFNAYCSKVVELLLLYPEITHVYIEKNTFQGADVIKIKELMSDNSAFKNRTIEFINEMQRSSKDEKISTIIDSVNNGQIIFVDNNQDFTDNILDFQGQKYSTHDDAVDITAECAKRLEAIKVIGKVTLFDKSKLGL